MSDVSPAVLEAQLAELARELDSAQSDLATLDETAVRAEHAHEIAFAHALLRAEGSNEQRRKAEATLATADSALEARIAAVKVRAAKGRLSVLSTRIDVGRTLASSARATWASAGRVA